MTTRQWRISHAANRRLRVAFVQDAHTEGGADQIRWLSGTYGEQWDLILLTRAPVSSEERDWVDRVLTTRLAPGGQIWEPSE